MKNIWNPNFTLFYFKFVKDYKGHDPQHWQHLLKDPGKIAWEGLAFERVCLLHSREIRSALGISGVAADESAWFRRSDATAGVRGAQIDLVIERADRVVNLCEMKPRSCQSRRVTAASGYG